MSGKASRHIWSRSSWGRLAKRGNEEESVATAAMVFEVSKSCGLGVSGMGELFNDCYCDELPLAKSPGQFPGDKLS